MFKERYDQAIELVFNAKNDDKTIGELRKEMTPVYHPLYMQGYKDALEWALSLKESCGDWLNENIKEELDCAKEEEKLRNCIDGVENK